MLAIVGVICVVLGLLFLWRFQALKKKQQEEKGFIVLVGAILFLWFYPGLALLVIGLLCLLAILAGVGL